MKAKIKFAVAGFCMLSGLLSGVGTNVAADEFNDLARVQQRALELVNAGRAREALPLADQLAGRAGDVFADHAGNLAASYETAGLTYFDLGQNAKAEALFKRVLSIREEIYGNEHAHVAMVRNNLGNLYRVQGQYADAERMHRGALAIREKVFGKEHPEVAPSLVNLALLFIDQARFAEAESFQLKALAIFEKTYGKDHPDVAMGLSSLAIVYWKQGRYSEAETLYLRSLAIRERHLGKEHFRVGENLQNLGLLYTDQARLVEAEPLLMRSLEIMEKVFGKESREVGDVLSVLGKLNVEQHRYGEAIKFFRQGLIITERILGKEHPSVARNLYNLANMYWTQSRYADAESMCLRALAIFEKTHGKDHPDVALVLNNLGFIYRCQDRDQEAISMQERALHIREKTLGPEARLVAASLNDLSLAHYGIREYAKAEELLRRPLKIWGKALDKDHPEVAFGWDNLARVLTDQERYAEAEKCFEQALAIREKAFGKDHTTVADTLCNLAEAYVAQEKFAQAEELADRVVAIWDLADAGAFNRYRGYSLRARVRWHAKKTDQAIADQNHALDMVEQMRGEGAGGETGRATRFAHFAGQYARMVAWQLELGRTGDVLTTIERSRARSLMDQLATANIDLLAGMPADEARLLQARQSTAQRGLAQLEKQVELILADQRLSKAEREQQVKYLEAKLQAAREEVVNAHVAIRNASPVYRQMVGKDFKPSNLAEVQSRLAGADGLLLEYFLAYDAGYVVIVPSIGGQARVEQLVVSKEQAASLGIEPGPLTDERMRAILANKTGTGLLQQLRSAEKAEATTDRLAVLWQVLVPESERKLLVAGKLKRCIVIPDAALAAFPFDTLIVEVGEKPKYLLDVGPPIITAPSATLLMNLTESKAGDDSAMSKKLLSVADPNYGVPSSAPVAALAELSARSRYGALKGELTPLPFTAWECSWVTGAFRKAGFDAGALQKASAREASVRMYAPGRKYLHFACHGLIDQSYGNLFGALALTPGPAGSSDTADDGFLTLAEIYELNLRGTELSILSACDTNYGPNQKGEGTWSLSRGFLVAGSKRVVASNWLVDDEAGASLVSVFCSDLVKEKEGEPLDYAASLQAAKRWVRNQEKWKSPYFWGTFVLVGPN